MADEGSGQGGGFGGGGGGSAFGGPVDRGRSSQLNTDPGTPAAPGGGGWSFGDLVSTVLDLLSKAHPVGSVVNTGVQGIVGKMQGKTPEEIDQRAFSNIMSTIAPWAPAAHKAGSLLNRGAIALGIEPSGGPGFGDIPGTGDSKDGLFGGPRGMQDILAQLVRMLLSQPQPGVAGTPGGSIPPGALPQSRSMAMTPGSQRRTGMGAPDTAAVLQAVLSRMQTMQAPTMSPAAQGLTGVSSFGDWLAKFLQSQMAQRNAPPARGGDAVPA